MKCYSRCIALCGAANLVTSGRRSDVLGMFRIVLLEKDGEDHLDRSCEKLISVAERQGGEQCRTYSK